MRGKIKLSLSGYASVLNDTIVIMTYEAFLLCTYLIVPINRTLTFFKGKFKLTQFEGISNYEKTPVICCVMEEGSNLLCCIVCHCSVLYFN